MKRCPTCNKTFTDQNLSYCIDDGTPLVSLPDDDEVTNVRPNTVNDYQTPAYQPPSYVAPESAEKKRVWPWVVGIASLLILLLAGFVVAAVMLVPRMMKRSEPIIVSNSNNSQNQNSNLNLNSNSAAENTNSPNANSQPGSTTPPPEDKEVVLAQLKEVEHEWTVANINADKQKLGQILADDYAGPNAQGRIQGKKEYLDTLERDTNIQKWEFEDLRLTLRGNRATLVGKVRYQLRDGEQVFDFVDRFVWRDNRWQATGSEVTPSE